jgi:CheY-like chemotaxis protein
LQPKILIIEDDPALLMLYSTMIKNGGYQPLIAANANAAIDAIHQEIPQLIIEDLSLPDLNGLQLVHCIRQIPNCEDTPVIILSGSSGRIESAKLSGEHFVAFLHKPVDQESLLEVIRKFLPSEK